LLALSCCCIMFFSKGCATGSPTVGCYLLPATHPPTVRSRAGCYAASYGAEQSSERSLLLGTTHPSVELLLRRSISASFVRCFFQEAEVIAVAGCYASTHSYLVCTQVQVIMSTSFLFLQMQTLLRKSILISNIIN
jgi:hypothetical protein